VIFMAVCSFIILIYSILIYLSYKKSKNYISVGALKKINSLFLNDIKSIKYIFQFSLLYLLSSIFIIAGKRFMIISIPIMIIMLKISYSYEKDMFSNKNFLVRIVGIIFMYAIIVIYGIGLTGVISNNNTNSKMLALGIINFLVIVLCSLWLTIMHFEKNVIKLLNVIICYFLIIAFGSWVFGIYYIGKNLWNKQIIEMINSEKSQLISLWELTKYGIGGFYNYPVDNVIGFVSLLQYFIGKFLDLFLLGYIFNVIFEMSRKTKEKNCRND